ncbi:MAG: selenide, water dikinase SelD [Nitrospirae bacterium]|nr:selenide, water dikinase SelD [Nitrospirota bacterium]
MLNSSTDPDLLVSYETDDDAAVYRLFDDTAVVSTTDFITPPVDDPYWFGQIAAANSLSDIYAMGATPFMALNLVMFPSSKLDTGILREILMGGGDKVKEAGALIAGGHSVDSLEPMYGLAVTGKINTKRILRNNTVKAGDALILTKQLGTGVIFNACRAGVFSWEKLLEILPEIAMLNKKAVETALEFDVSACTDVTGFGLAGHVLEMTRSSRLTAEIEYKKLPFYDGALEMYKKGQGTGSNKANKTNTDLLLKVETRLSNAELQMLFDPQTSGGLLISLPNSQADGLIKLLKERGVNSAEIIGNLVESDDSVRMKII